MSANRQLVQYTAFKITVIVLFTVFIQANFVEARSLVEECPFCKSKECLYQSRILLKHISPSIDPCQDFYSFACGGYLEQFGKDDTRSTYDDTWNNFLTRIKDLLEHLEPDVGTVSEKLKAVYDVCMDKESSEIKAVPDALDFLSQVGVSQWPSLGADFEFAELSETLGSLAVYGEFAFITFQSSPYKQKNELSQLTSALILPDNYLMDGKLKPKDVHKSVLKILTYFGFDTDESETVWESFKEIEDRGIKFQNEETAENTACTNGSSAMYTKVNCSAETHGSMTFLCDIWKSAVKTGELSRHYSTDILHISCRWNHYNYIEKILSSVITLNHKSLAHYLSLRFFTSHLDDLNLYFQLIKKSFSKPKDPEQKTTGTVHRMEYCIGWIIKSMHLALGHEYTERFLKKPIQKNVLDILQNYLQELTNKISLQKWINERVKSYLKRQLEKLEIGFKKSMKNFRNETVITDFYREFQPVGGSFLKNILEYTKSSIATKKENPNFNSFYSSSDSYNMDFGLSLFLPPTYSYGLPKIMNYATLGWIIGHELSHNLKFLFDLVHLDDETESNLNSRMGCYVNQYSRFVMEKTGKGITSKDTEEEIVADNIGWTLTEKIMNTFSDSALTVNLPGLEYTPLQIMYISFAQESCAALSKAVEHEFYTSKPHNIQKLRVLSVLQNSKMFSETFNCSSDRIMNPSTKCIFFEEV